MVIAGREIPDSIVKEAIRILQVRMMMADQHCDRCGYLEAKTELEAIQEEVKACRGFREGTR